MRRAGRIPGGLWSEVKNIHSNRVYFISTSPVLEQDYWMSAVVPSISEKKWFGLKTIEHPDIRHPVVTIVRNTMRESHDIHAIIEGVITMIPEDQWICVFPHPMPPDGLTEGARQRLIDTLGYDPTV